MDGIRQDLKRAFRSIWKAPLFSAAVIATLALAAGLSTTGLALVNGVLLRPLPFPDSDRIATLWFELPAGFGLSEARQSPATYTLFGEEARAFEHVAIARPRAATVTETETRDREENTELLGGPGPRRGRDRMRGRAAADAARRSEEDRERAEQLEKDAQEAIKNSDQVEIEAKKARDEANAKKVAEEEEGWLLLDVQEWAIEVLNVPVYPEKRIFKRVLIKICDCSEGAFLFFALYEPQREEEMEYYDCSEMDKVF